MTQNHHTELRAELTRLEQQVWDALAAGDASVDAALLCDGFLGVYSDGFAGKADHAGQLSEGPTVAEYHLTDLRARWLGPDHALLSYHATFLRQGRDAPEAMYVSSIWHHRAQGWVNIFSQDTPAQPTIS